MSLIPFTEDDFFLPRRLRRSPLNELALLDNGLFGMIGSLSSLEEKVNSLMRQLRSSNRLCDSFDMGNLSVLSIVEDSEKGSGEGKFIVNIPLGTNISPEDLKVGVKDNVMTIEAKKEEKSEDGSFRQYQEYVRKFTLPPNVNSKEVTSVLTAEGNLKIEAPIMKPVEKIYPVMEQQCRTVQERMSYPIPIQMN